MFPWLVWYLCSECQLEQFKIWKLYYMGPAQGIHGYRDLALWAFLKQLLDLWFSCQHHLQQTMTWQSRASQNTREFYVYFMACYFYRLFFKTDKIVILFDTWDTVSLDLLRLSLKSQSWSLDSPNELHIPWAHLNKWVHHLLSCGISFEEWSLRSYFEEINQPMYNIHLWALCCARCSKKGNWVTPGLKHVEHGSEWLKQKAF